MKTGGASGARKNMEKAITFFINRSTPVKLEEEVKIPKPLKRLTISVDVEKEEYALMGYLVVRDEKNRIRLQKMIGYGEKTMVIGKHAGNTTISGVPGPVGKGTWKLELYLFTEYIAQKLGEASFPLRIIISDKKVEIQEVIGKELWVDRHYREPLWLGFYNKKSFYSSRERWYKGDFHTHTHLSDGKETIEQAMKKAEQMEMDFYVPTEHNVIPTGWKDDSMLVLPGVEITTEIGHCNLIGIDKMPERLPEIMEYMNAPEVEEYLYETIREAKKRGWILSINHPFLTIWKWRYGKLALHDVTCMEIVNDPTYPDAGTSNDLAIRFLDFLWEDGHTIWGIGGSDSHNRVEERYENAEHPSIPGDPGTYVYCSSLTPELLVENVKAGHIYVSRFCTVSIQMTSNGEKILPGDRLEDEEREIKVELYLQGQEEMPELWLIQNQKKMQVEMEPCEEGYRACVETTFAQGNWNWMRLEGRTQKGEFLLYTNPVWQGEKKSCFHSYEEAQEAFYEN